MNSNKQMKVVVNRFRMEIASRETVLYLDEENIQEFLNILFPLIEALRMAIRDNVSHLTDDKNGILIFTLTLKLINDCLYFENVWNYSYSTWHSAFKANRKNNTEYCNSEPSKYYDIQSYYPKSGEILEDMHTVKTLIKKYMENLDGISKEIALKENPFIYYWLKFYAFIRIFKY